MTEKPDIVQVAQILGCLPEKRSGDRYQGGNCPAAHQSIKGRCWTIYLDTQSCYCHHCHIGGDSYEIIEAKLKCGFLDAVSWAKERGLITGNSHNEASYAELRKVHLILTDAAKFFHSNLKDLTHLKEHYGLSEEIIQQYLIGYAPLDKHALKNHLITKGYELADINKTSLLSKYDDSFFQGQYIFPYWHLGLVKYFIGRQTPETPDWKTGKYEKLPTTDIIKNDFFYGEDSIRGKDNVFVAEGVTDCLAALQHGLASISPVTTQFKKADHPKLLSLVRGKRVYLIPDNEESQAGMKGAQENLSFLKGSRVEASIITLPRPEGKKKIDLNEYVRDHGIDAFLKLVKEQSPPSISDIILEVSDFVTIKFPPKKSILNPWIKEYQIIMIYGPRGVGKSMFVISLLIAIVTGNSFGPWETISPVNCLYLDGEMVQQDTAERFVTLIDGDIKVKLFIYSDAYANVLGVPGANLLDEEWRKCMKEILLQNNVKVWVADNIASLAPGIDENCKQDWDPINRWFLDLRFAGITTIFLHHDNKEGRQRGTSGREDNIDISLHLERPKDYASDQGARFIAKFEKARIRHHDLHLIRNTEFWLKTGENGSYIWIYGSSKKAQVIKKLDEGMAAKDIAEELGITSGRVSQIKAEAVKEGLITKEGKLTQTGFEWLSKN